MSPGFFIHCDGEKMLLKILCLPGPHFCFTETYKGRMSLAEGHRSQVFLHQDTDIYHCGLGNRYSEVLLLSVFLHRWERQVRYSDGAWRVIDKLFQSPERSRSKKKTPENSNNYSKFKRERRAQRHLRNCRNWGFQKSEVATVFYLTSHNF